MTREQKNKFFERLGITSGPWFFDAGSFYAECQLDDIGYPSEDPIAEMIGGRDCDYTGNGNLISKAPEMLFCPD